MNRADERAHLRLGLITLAGFLTAAVVVPLAVLVRDRWAPLRDADARAIRVLRLPHGAGRDVVLVLTQLGAPLLLELTVLVIAGVLLSRGRVRIMVYVALTVFGAELLSSVAKHIVARVRPCVDSVGCPETMSFPSGHAVGAAAFWTAIALLLLPAMGRRVFAIPLLIPLVVACTRVLLGVHYPSDVVAGLVLGWAWAIAVTAVFAVWRDEAAGRDVPLEAGLE